MTPIQNIKIQRSNSSNLDFLSLVKLLDKDLDIRDGADHSFYAQYNKLDKINHVVIAYAGQIPVGCGAFKEYEKDKVEIKRMYVLENYRNKGIAGLILQTLEQWAIELGYSSAILETGLMQPEAIGLYKKSGYDTIPNYDQYAGIENSVCFHKTLTKD
ncbi:putative acetyltransferase [Indibacter alkaliphilus LW1]|uniref:Acetyltransferase n=1 Tax=Indibacter alkaliphilus (strain CCUG 57479 / KCTC 22604 / LW1) TaxID=1189612 RepID=S2DGR1_INDAL|nr:GNAT family N-acetyltransferase [Indibacter alkaliphilus]EOZ98104.1 putative acetyltransferase [Indibacter alkaliphilus LW1]